MKIAIIGCDTRLNSVAINKIMKINKKYAEMNGYQYFYDFFKIENLNYDWEELIINDKNFFQAKAYYHRIELVEKYLNDFDYIVYIDSDACICNPNIKIEDLIDFEHDFFISQDLGLLITTTNQINAGNVIQKYLKEKNLQYLKNPLEDLLKLKISNEPIIDKLNVTMCNPNGLNTGFMIFKNSKIIKDFIKDFKRYYIMFKDCLCDQGCVAHLLKYPKYKNMVKVLPLITQGSPIFPNEDFTYNENKNFICHYYGTNKESSRVINHINSIEHNKWWVKI